MPQHGRCAFVGLWLLHGVTVRNVLNPSTETGITVRNVLNPSTETGIIVRNVLNPSNETGITREE
jgi:hypothetical protein